MTMKPHSWLPWRIVLALSLVSGLVHAEVTLDGSLGGPTGALPGPEFQIPAEVGQLQGANLFHSFGAFNLNAVESATFTGSNSVQNILGRVTGGSASSIDGLIRSLIPGADLYLINPFGIMFGPNAQLDVQGSFHATTADYIRLQDGARFNAVPSSADVTLTVAPPEAFGFLGENPAGISVVGDASDNPSLQVPAGETLSLIGGDITVTDRTVEAEGGHINIASVGSSGEVKVSDTGVALEGVTQRGNIQVSQGGFINASGPGGGAIFIRGGEFVVEDSTIDASTTGELDGRGIDIDIAGKLGLTNGQIQVLNLGNNTGGNINITAGESMDIVGTTQGGVHSAYILTGTLGEGDAGDIKISAPELNIDEGAIRTITLGDGDAGVISIDVERLALIDGAELRSGSGLEDLEGNVTVGMGQAGDIEVTASESISMSGLSAVGGSTAISSSTLGSGKAGSITIHTPYLSIDEGLIQAITLGDGAGGDIQIETGELTLTTGTQIASSSGATNVLTGEFLGGEGEGGNVTIMAEDRIFISGRDKDGFPSGISTQTNGSGKGGDIFISTPTLDISSGGSLDSGTNGAGNGGNIILEVGSLYMSDHAEILAGSSASSQAGSITVRAQEAVSVSGGSELSSNSLGSGNSGDILVEARRLELTGGGSISNSEAFEGHGGNITVAVKDLITVGGLDNTDDFFEESGIYSLGTLGGSGGSIFMSTPFLEMQDGIISAEALPGFNLKGGDAGNINLDVGTLQLTDGAKISAATLGEGKGGNLFVEAEQIRLSGAMVPFGDFTGITTQTEGKGDAGALTINTGSLEVLDGAEISASTFGEGQGGMVSIHATEAISLSAREGSFTTISTSASSTGNAGRIILSTPSLAMDGTATVEATTIDDGNAGNIEVTAGRVSLTGGAQIGSTSGIVSAQGVPIVGKGNGGTVLVHATESLMITGQHQEGIASGLFSETGGTGAAGLVRVITPRLVMADHGQISTNTAGAGPAGEIVVEAAGSVSLSDEATIDSSNVIAVGDRTFIGTGPAGAIRISADDLTIANSRIASSTASSGQGGDIEIHAGSVTLREGGVITAESSGTLGDAGESGRIVLESDSLRLFDGSSISVETARADAGDIVLNVRSLLHLRDQGRITTSVAGGQGNGGNIRIIDPVFVILDGSSAIVANAREGAGGNIDIQINENGGALFQSPDSIISASSALGIDGSVAIEAPDTDISGSIEHLPTPFLNAAALLQDRCSTRTAETASTFIIRGPNVQPGPEEAWGASGVSILPDLPSLKDTHPAPDSEGSRTSQAGSKPALKLGCAGV